MPFYVAPEQFMKDKADYARKGIARGRALVAAVFDAGIVLAAENPSTNLHKISEIYDRIAFAGVGRYNEFDTLRVAGVQHADSKGYQYSREDVDARALANAYAQQLGLWFTHEAKPFEVEILVAEVTSAAESDQLFHILYDGTVSDETNFSALGGDSDAIGERMTEAFKAGWSLADALKGSIGALAGPERTLTAGDLEVAILDRVAPRRAFRRLTDGEVESLLS